MIIEEIKNSIRNALFEADEEIIFHFEEIAHTGFPTASLVLNDFKISPASAYDKQKCEFKFELTYMKSEDNKLSELLEGQELIQAALLPCIKVLERKITLDDVIFKTVGKKLVMTFGITLYAFEDDTAETMQTLDITLKGE